jgi:serine/threonine protein phosphatase PrpC
MEDSVTELLEKRLFSNKDLVAGEIHGVGSGIAVVYSSREPESDKEKNEDAAAIFQLNGESGVLVVADGVGGHRSGERASAIAIKSLQTSLKEPVTDKTQLRSNIINAFEKANQAVMDLGIGAATTLAVVEIAGKQIRPYHVGDSEIAVLGQRGKVKLQIVPHSPVGYAVESGMLDENSAMHHEDRHLVSNLIGTTDMHIQVGAPLTLSKHDTVLLASDGLADNVHFEEIVAIIRKGPLDKAAEKLARKALERMSNPSEGDPSKPDDLTFILFRLAK